MKQNIIVLLSISLFFLSSCSKDDTGTTTSDFRPNIVGEFTTWSAISYDKDLNETGTTNGSGMIEIKANAATENAVNVFLDGTFIHALMNGLEKNSAYVFDYLTNGTLEGHAGIEVDGTKYHAVYYKGNNTLVIFNVLFESGVVKNYTKTTYSGKK